MFSRRKKVRLNVRIDAGLNERIQRIYNNWEKLKHNHPDGLSLFYSRTKTRTRIVELLLSGRTTLTELEEYL